MPTDFFLYRYNKNVRNIFTHILLITTHAHLYTH
uniref:Uncharacterized protein n=1 Tax=Arundo donax TaxID=35708 RepID=A0A0A9AYB7_ARUDO